MSKEHYDSLEPAAKALHSEYRFDAAETPEHLLNAVKKYYRPEMPQELQSRVLESAKMRLDDLASGSLGKDGRRAVQQLRKRFGIGDKEAAPTTLAKSYGKWMGLPFMLANTHAAVALKQYGHYWQETADRAQMGDKQMRFADDLVKHFVWAPIKAIEGTKEGLRKARILFRVASTPRVMIDMPYGETHANGWTKRDWMASREHVKEFESWGAGGREALKWLRLLMDRSYRQLVQSGDLKKVTGVPTEIDADGKEYFLYVPLGHADKKETMDQWELDQLTGKVGTKIQEQTGHPHLRPRGKQDLGFEQQDPFKLMRGYNRYTARRVNLSPVLPFWEAVRKNMPQGGPQVPPLVTNPSKYLKDWTDRLLGKPHKSDEWFEAFAKILDAHYQRLRINHPMQDHKMLDAILQRSDKFMASLTEPRALGRMTRMAMQYQYLRLFGGITPTPLVNATQGINNVLEGGVKRGPEGYAMLALPSSWKKIKDTNVIQDFENSIILPGAGEQRLGALMKAAIGLNAIPEALSRGSAVMMALSEAKEKGLDDAIRKPLVAGVPELGIGPLTLPSRLPGILPERTVQERDLYTDAEKYSRAAEQRTQFGYGPASQSPYMVGNWRFLTALWSYPSRQLHTYVLPTIKAPVEAASRTIMEGRPLRETLPAAVRRHGMEPSLPISPAVLFGPRNYWRYVMYTGLMITLGDLLRKKGIKLRGLVGANQLAPQSWGPVATDALNLARGTMKLGSGNKLEEIPELTDLAKSYVPWKTRAWTSTRRTLSGDFGAVNPFQRVDPRTSSERKADAERRKALGLPRERAQYPPWVRGEKEKTEQQIQREERRRLTGR